jgi:uncharacterized protein
VKIIVQDIPDEGIEIEDEEAFEEEDGLRSRALLTVRVERAGADVFIRGEARAGLVLTCSRCLEDFTGEIGFPVDLAYCPERGAGGQESHELSPDELETGFYSGEDIDLREITKEQVLLNMPMKPLCAETCKGICPGCGANLNAGDCGCDLKGADPRFGALRDFFKKRKE